MRVSRLGLPATSSAYTDQRRFDRLQRVHDTRRKCSVGSKANPNAMSISQYALVCFYYMYNAILRFSNEHP